KPEQIRYLVQKGAIRPLCDLLTCPDNKIIQVALDGLENILKVGDMDKEASEGTGEQPVNRYALFIEDCSGMEKIHDCQNNSNEEIYMKAYHLIEKYFSDEEADAELNESAPQGQDGQFGFGAQQQQQNFNFANGAADNSMEM
ncbi:Importin subunit alpha-1, partial [Teratosphaeriaceae sp. CCFEE 6253]